MDQNHNAPRKFGPKRAGHPGIGKLCQACNVPMAEGDYTTLIALGPGNDPENQQACRAGLPYSAVAIEVHWACATGQTD